MRYGYFDDENKDIFIPFDKLKDINDISVKMG